MFLYHWLERKVSIAGIIINYSKDSGKLGKKVTAPEILGSYAFQRFFLHNQSI